MSCWIRSSPAPLFPFLVVDVSYRAVEASSGLDLWGHSWAGWMARPPADWAGALDILAGVAPPGAVARWGADHGEFPSGDGVLEFSPVGRPPGKGAPWVAFEESVHRDPSSPSVMRLSLRMEVEGPIPREWTGSWHREMTDKFVLAPGRAMGAALEAAGFEVVESLGDFDDMCGDEHCVAVALRRAQGWVARAEAEALGRSTPVASAAGRGRVL